MRKSTFAAVAVMGLICVGLLAGFTVTADPLSHIAASWPVGPELAHYLAGGGSAAAVLPFIGNLKAWREKRATVVADMRAILDAAAADNDRDLNEDEVKKYDALKADKVALDARIARAEELEASEAALGAVRPAAARGNGVIHPPGPEASREFESFGEFIAAVAFNPNDQRLNFVEGKEGPNGVRAEQRMDSGASGGFAVPTQFRDTLMSVESSPAIIRPRATVIPAGDPPDAAISIPALDQASGSAPANVFGGVEVTWTGEGAEVSETDLGLREIKLEPQEVSGLVVVTNKLLRNWMAASPLIERQLRLAVAAAEDTKFLKGSGAGTPLGILNAAATYLVNRAGANNVTYADVVAMVARLRGPGLWVYSRSVLPKLMLMEDTEGHLIWTQNAVAGQPSMLAGIPAIESERNPTLGTKGDLWLADLSQYLIKDGSGPLVSASEHVHFKQNKTVIKIVWNVDGQPWLTEPFTGEDGYETSPLVALDVPA